MWEVKRKIDRGPVLAALVLATFDKDPEPEHVEIEDLSKMLAKLDDDNVLDLSDFSISPGGEYCEDVARFVGNYLLCGEAETRSPLKFSIAGIKRCRAMICEAIKNKEAAKEISMIEEALEASFQIDEASIH